MRQRGERGKDKDRAKEMLRAKSTQEKNCTEKAKEMEGGEIPEGELEEQQQPSGTVGQKRGAGRSRARDGNSSHTGHTSLLLLLSRLGKDEPGFFWKCLLSN